MAAGAGSVGRGAGAPGRRGGLRLTLLRPGTEHRTACLGIDKWSHVDVVCHVCVQAVAAPAKEEVKKAEEEALVDKGPSPAAAEALAEAKRKAQQQQEEEKKKAMEAAKRAEEEAKVRIGGLTDII